MPSGKDRRDWKYFYRDFEKYVSCMQHYLKNAERDIERIKEKTQAALRDYEDYMNKVKRRQEP